MKNFVKALHKNGAAFQHLSTVFPGLSAAKLKEGILVRPQIREVMKDTDWGASYLKGSETMGSIQVSLQWLPW